MPKTSKRKKNVQVGMPDSDREQYEKIAEERDISLSELLRRVLSKALRDKLYEQL